MQRRHILITPDPKGSLDFVRSERGTDGVWFTSGTPVWLPLLLPTAFAAVASGADFTFSAFRQIPLRDPSTFALPPAPAFSVKLFAPLGKPHPEDQWGAVLYMSQDQSSPPASAGEKFVANNGGLRRVLDAFFTTDRIDTYRKNTSRPFEEIWIRHDLTIEALSPETYHCPAWQKDPAVAAALLAQKVPMSGAEYYRLKHGEAVKKQQAQAEQAGQASPEAEAKQPATPEHVVTPEEIREAKRLRERQSRATKSKVRADKFNASAAQAYGKRVAGL